jgi:mannose-6-phosphate isomerase-like protein (cupin superfamily)
MEIRPLVRAELPLENNAYGQRLVPWPALNAPFEGAWVIVPAGNATGAHSHHEYEIFIAISGEAEIETNGERKPFRPGDIEYHAPGLNHRVINDGDADFQFYAVWWDDDMSERFVKRHEESDYRLIAKV